LLVAVGTNDKYGLLPRSKGVFNAANVASKVLLTVTGGDHRGIYVGASPEARAVRHETVRFDVAFRAEGTTSAGVRSALDRTGDPSLLLTAGPPG
jgi:hypothetical protein